MTGVGLVPALFWGRRQVAAVCYVVVGAWRDMCFLYIFRSGNVY